MEDVVMEGVIEEPVPVCLWSYFFVMFCLFVCYVMTGGMPMFDHLGVGY